jgi:hypothetical protein
MQKWNSISTININILLLLMQLQKLALQIQIIKIVKININKLLSEMICIKSINKGQYYIFYINKKE